MKKLFTMLLLVCTLSLTTGVSFASTSKIKNFNGYQIQNKNIRDMDSVLEEIVTGRSNTKKIDAPNTYLYTDKNGASFYVRLYPANKNANIYVVSNTKYDINNNYLINEIKKTGYSYTILKDKAAMKEYEFDFYDLARANKLGTFYITPDVIKPVKDAMAKYNDWAAKKSEKTSVIPYAADTEKITLALLDSTTHNDAASGISIIRNEYRPKEKTYKYMHAYEYILTNNTDKNAKVTGKSDRLAGMKDVTTETFIDLDRYNLAGAVGCLPPVLVCTFGLSILLAVPSWVRYGTITKEATRYTHALPENIELKAHKSMRVLVFKYKNKGTIATIDFKIDFGDNVYHIEY